MNDSRWKIVSIELGEPLPELQCEPGYGGLHVFFFRRGVPLGQRRFSAEQLPLGAAQLASCAAAAIAPAIGDYLLEEGFRSALPGLPEPRLENSEQALARLLDLDRPATEFDSRLSGAEPVWSCSVSVAVCTHERPERLARCLQSLLASSERPREVIVIDNAPRTDATREVVSRFPGVRYCQESRAGLSAARNAALALAKGDVVAFADDDVVVHPDWVARIARCFGDPKVMVATGLVLPGELETPAQTIFENDFQFFHQGFRRRHFGAGYFAALRRKCVPVWSIGAGANMAIRREVFERGYRFDTRLGPGVFGGCGEDSELWYRLLADGWSCVYQPSAVVYHFHRRELDGLRRLVLQYMEGHVASLLLQFARSRDVGNLRRLLLVLPAEYCLLFLRLIVTGFALQYRILLSGALGCLSGLRFCWQAWASTPPEDLHA